MSRRADRKDSDASYYLIARQDLVDLIPPETKKVLEIGCAGGMTGKVLKERGFEEIVGVEILEEVARQGAEHYTTLIIGDVEKLRLPFEKAHFDCILYADVLEHLVDPWKVLREHNALLRPGGVVVCSVPNVRHYKVIKQLVFAGRWEYRKHGILDRTHLRFFTLHSIRKMLHESGFEVARIVKRPSGATFWKVVNRLSGNLLINFLVRQYKIVAVKTKDSD